MTKVLVVDDDLALRGMLAMSIETAGYQVTEVGSANEAIQSLKSSRDTLLVVLDMGMPPNEHSPEEGIKVLGWIKNHTLDIKTIVLTGQAPEGTSYQAILHGAFDFLEKPIEFPALLSALKRAESFSLQTSKIQQQESRHKIELDVLVGGGKKCS